MPNHFNSIWEQKSLKNNHFSNKNNSEQTYKLITTDGGLMKAISLLVVGVVVSMTQFARAEDSAPVNNVASSQVEVTLDDADFIYVSLGGQTDEDQIVEAKNISCESIGDPKIAIQVCSLDLIMTETSERKVSHQQLDPIASEDLVNSLRILNLDPSKVDAIRCVESYAYPTFLQHTCTISP